MDDFILTLGWVGVYAPLALGAVGSMVGVGRGGMAACGALLEVESGYGRFIGVSAMPSSQTIYGIVVTLTLNVGVNTDNAPGIFGIGRRCSRKSNKRWPRLGRHRRRPIAICGYQHASHRVFT